MMNKVEKSIRGRSEDGWRKEQRGNKVAEKKEENLSFKRQKILIFRLTDFFVKNQMQPRRPKIRRKNKTNRRNRSLKLETIYER